MARSFTRASSHYLEVDVAPVTAYPFTMAAWANTDDATVIEQVMFLCDKDVADVWHGLDFTGTGDLARCISVNGAAVSVASSTGSFTVNAWQHVCGVWTSATSRTIYLNGGNSATNTTSVLVGAVDRLSVGRRGDSTPDSYWSGLLAEVSLWDVALTADEVGILADGFSPLTVRPANLITYHPLLGRYSPEISLKNSAHNLTVTSATVAAHPRIIIPGQVHIPKAITIAVGYIPSTSRMLTGIGV